MVFFLVLCGSVSVCRPSLEKDRAAGRRVGVVFRGHHAQAPGESGLVRAKEKKSDAEERSGKRPENGSNGEAEPAIRGSNPSLELERHPAIKPRSVIL
jgi:hypothetical protein